MRKKDINYFYFTIQPNYGSLATFGNFKWNTLQLSPPPPTYAFYKFLLSLHVARDIPSSGWTFQLGWSPCQSSQSNSCFLHSLISSYRNVNSIWLPLLFKCPARCLVYISNSLLDTCRTHVIVTIHSHHVQCFAGKQEPAVSVCLTVVFPVPCLVLHIQQLVFHIH